MEKLNVKIGRNTLCPCGSGKKYKRCCGANIEQANQVDSSDQARPRKITRAARSCGECSQCCDGWLTTHALGNDIRVGQPCPYTENKRCSIHEKRPQEPCRNFFCAWAKKDSALPDWMHPSLCNIIVLDGRVKWRGSPVDVLVSAGQDPDQKILHWYQELSMQTMRPFIYMQNEHWFGFGPQQFQVDIAEKVARGEALWDGSLDT